MNVAMKLKKIDDQALVKFYIEQSIDENSCFDLINAINSELYTRFPESAMLEIERRIDEAM